MGFHSLFLFVQTILLRFDLLFFFFLIIFHLSPTGVTELFFLVSKTVEAERISVDHVAHLKPSDGGSAATQCKPLSPPSFLVLSLTIFAENYKLVLQKFLSFSIHIMHFFEKKIL